MIEIALFLLAFVLVCGLHDIAEAIRKGGNDERR